MGFFLSDFGRIVPPAKFQQPGRCTPLEILRSIQFYSEAHDMPFIVIGGHAVNAYGISRQTGDLDLMVPVRHRAEWRQLMLRLKYTATQGDGGFARFSPPDLNDALGLLRAGVTGVTPEDLLALWFIRFEGTFSCFLQGLP